jgi:hypothetical protein
MDIFLRRNLIVHVALENLRKNNYNQTSLTSYSKEMLECRLHIPYTRRESRVRLESKGQKQLEADR